MTAPKVTPAEPIKRYRVLVFKGGDEIQAYEHPEGSFVLYHDHAAYAAHIAAPLEAENTTLKARVAAWEQWRDLEKVRNATALAGVREENTALKARVVELEAALDKLARLGNEPDFGNSRGNEIARAALAGKANGGTK